MGSLWKPGLENLLEDICPCLIKPKELELGAARIWGGWGGSSVSWFGEANEQGGSRHPGRALARFLHASIFIHRCAGCEGPSYSV